MLYAEQLDESIEKNFKKVLKGGESSSQTKNSETIIAQPLEVRVYNNFDKALRAFRALVQKERVLSTYKERQTYEKPSQKKRRKRNEMKRKLMEDFNRRSSPHYKNEVKDIE